MADDLTSLPQPDADPYAKTPENEQAVVELVKSRFDVFNRGRENFLPWAYRNILFYRGHQWIYLDRVLPTYWRPIRPRDPNMPMPVTNKFKELLDSFVSMVARFEPNITYAPATDEAEDRATAEVSTRVMEVIGDEVGITTSRQRGSKWFTLTGGYWRETGYDNDPAYGTDDVPMMVCATEGCGHQQPPDPMMPMAGGAPEVDPMGNMPGADPMAGGPPCPKCQAPMAQQAVPMPKGRMFVTERSVFEMFFDPSVTDWARQRDYVCQNAVDVDQGKARWTKLADSIKADTTGGNVYRESLPTVGPGPGLFQRAMFGGTGRIANTKATENWYWKLPDAKYPQGLCVVMLGKTPTQLAWFGPLPYYFEDEQGGKAYFLPHVFFPQSEVPGSAWPSTVADDLADKQRERNQWEMMIRLCGMKMANPIWLSPRGASLSSPTGTPGQFLEYNPVPMGGALLKPERLDGRPIPIAFTQNIERIDREMEGMAASPAVRRGMHEPGVRAAIAQQQLKEQAESQFGPMFIRLNHGEAEWSRQAIAIFKLFATEERLLKIKGRDGGWEVQKFMAGDLRGRVDVIAEAGVTMPRTTMSERAEMQEAIEMGILDPRDPQQRREMQKRMGVLHYVPMMDRDVKRAAIENEMFRMLAQSPAVQQMRPEAVQQVRQAIQMQKQMGMAPPDVLAIVENIFTSVGLQVPRVNQAIDDHAVHGQEHRVDAKGESFLERPELVQIFEEAHLAAHDFYQGQAMLAAQAAQQPPAKVNLQGKLTPEETAHFAGDQKPGPAQGSPANPANAARSSSSPARMAGEAHEMARNIR